MPDVPKRTAKEPALEAVLFDVYGTLLDVTTDESADSRLWRDLLAPHPADPAALHARYLELCAAEAERVGGLHPDFDLPPVLAALAAEAGAHAAARDPKRLALRFRALSRRGLFPRPGAAETLDLLRARGLKLAVVSNAQTVFTDEELGRFDLPRRFDTIVYSSDARARKPDPLPFRIALERLGLEPEACAYVGDDPMCDVPTPAVLGMRTIFLGTWHGTLKPDIVIADGALARIPAALDQLNEAERL